MPSGIYNETIYAPVRQTKAVVRFELVAPEAKEKADVTANSNAAFSRQNQLIDNVTDMSEPIATFEPDYWRLDGSFALPVQPSKSELQVGWWGGEISDVKGEFKTIPQIHIEFSEVQNIATFGITFDEAGYETVSDLEFFVYDSAKKLILNERITDNEKIYVNTEKGALNAASVDIKLYKTKNPFRRPRVTELGFGVTVNFDGDDILSLGLVCETDPSSRTFPINELNLKVMNNNRFDQLDKDSLAQYLYKRQAFEYKHGLVLSGGRTEWVYRGAYFLDSWSVSDAAVEFMARGKSGVLENSTFYGSTFSTMDVGTLIDSVMARTGFDYIIPGALRESPKVAGYLGNVTYRQAATYLAELGVCAVRENKQNNIDFIDLLRDNAVTDNINYDNMFSPPKVKLGSYYNGVILKEKSISVKTEQIARAQITVAGSADISIYFDKPLYASAATYTITTGFTLTNIKYQAMYMTAMIIGTGTAEITVTGDSAAFVESENFYNAPWRNPLEPDFGYVVDLPMIFLNNIQFRNWFLERKFKLLQKRLTCNIAWRQNPAQDVGDTVLVQANKNNSNVPMITVSQTIDYSGGALRGSTKTIGEAAI